LQRHVNGVESDSNAVSSVGRSGLLGALASRSKISRFAEAEEPWFVYLDLKPTRAEGLPPVFAAGGHLTGLRLNLPLVGGIVT